MGIATVHPTFVFEQGTSLIRNTQPPRITIDP